VELTSSDKGIPTEGMVQNQNLTHLYRNDAHGTTDSRPVSCDPKSARSTDNKPFVQDLICSLNGSM